MPTYLTAIGGAVDAVLTGRWFLVFGGFGQPWLNLLKKPEQPKNLVVAGLWNLHHKRQLTVRGRAIKIGFVLKSSMGHPVCDERPHFINLKLECGNSRMWHTRKHCDKAYKESQREDGTFALPEPTRIEDRIENFRSHLKRCISYHVAVQSGRSTASCEGTGSCQRSATGQPSSIISHRRQKRIEEYFPGKSQVDDENELERLLLEFQANHNLPETLIERSSTARLLRHTHKMKSDVISLPKRRTLGGLKTGGRVNFCSDDWQNIAREHLLDYKISLYGNELTYGLYTTGSRHDGIAIAEKMENVLIAMKNDGWKIGAVITDNAGQCGRARRILSLRWPELAFVICFAHDLNNLVKDELKSDYATVTEQASDAGNAILASSSKWLV
ncbi:unnamed protein product [Phytophthora fragariaefolia]|uniref:Unnamed protein product n=1 Tax=Phytophthora fragariaefolia TaxID=1490495 RepID=A0A9W6YCL7_9STRA|nr:unnamed protein product [Phytophthora fragariaefolia]